MAVIYAPQMADMRFILKDLTCSTAIIPAAATRESVRVDLPAKNWVF